MERILIIYKKFLKMTINNDVYINQLEPTAKAAMLIRKPIDQVFEAFINPNIT
ncbi:MAG: hypothetical protein AB8U88_07665 [Rickettsia conorii subsp. raoultii]|uniref:Acyl-[acyl-carrier-protein]--UDP-N-acetylglucosamine O-acyltransferase n=1 Tax=Rickettsia conorii subsp. raoultii TaxID=369822 RepID=A0ABY4U298_RICCR|nr:hypothetical protein [Rickettsia conorii]URW77967.1 hypothetical protein NBT09_00955 [Rickettsia conorii subsp. raoultii]